ncbi:M35 family metallo-endopeptidase [Chondromyces crocatus]|nr:M35 family metallo-endopeptidase [Chondromyces crocatus]
MNKSLRGRLGAVLGGALGLGSLSGCMVPGGEVGMEGEGPIARSGALQVSLSGADVALMAQDEVTVTVTFTNASTEPVRVPRWYTGGEAIQERVLEVTRDGTEVAYLGPIVKRMAPRDADLITLLPGEQVERVVVLSDDYDLSVSGAYAVSFRVDGEAHDGEVGGTAAAGAMRPGAALASARAPDLSLWIEGRSNWVQESRARRKASAVDALTFSGGCSTSRQSTIVQAMDAAETYAQGAHEYLTTTTPSGTGRYKTWFGTYTTARWATAQKQFLAIRDAFVGQDVTVDCSCTDSGVYAYVYPREPYNIYVCGAFWSAPMTGTDSKGGTLVHEMSHFAVVAETDDHAYGHTAAKNLAKSSPTKALNNADNHEFFAENTPTLL